MSLLSQGRKGEDLPEESENFRAKSRLIIFFLIFLYSQSPNVPELSHQNIFQLSRLSMNCFVETVKKSDFLNRTDFIKSLSVSQNHRVSNNNVMKIFSKIIDFIVLTIKICMVTFSLSSCLCIILWISTILSIKMSRETAG